MSAHIRMKGDISYKILSALSDSAVNVGDLFSVIVAAGYGASVSQLNFRLEKRRRFRETARVKNEDIRVVRARYSSIVFKLKRDGLILVDDREAKITKNGLAKLVSLKNRKAIELPMVSYEKETAKIFTIVAFDIPEKDRRKRAWLRRALAELGLEMIQRSVWLGKVKIPESFIRDMAELKILNYVDIFEITKAGTLSRVG